MITDDSLENFCARAWAFFLGGGFSVANTHPTHNPCYARCLFLRCVVLVDKCGGQQRCPPYLATLATRNPCYARLIF